MPNDDQLNQKRLKLVKRLMLFPVVLIISYFFGTINRIYLYFYVEDPILALTVLHIFFRGMIGLMNLLVYGLKRNVRSLLKESFKNCCPCYTKRPFQDNPPPLYL